MPDGASERRDPTGSAARLRILAYYALLLGGTLIAWQRWPALMPHFGTVAEAIKGKHGTVMAANPGHTTAAWTVALAMTSAALLSLPVAWVYRLTRAKKGYQQAVMQTLVLLPTVVAGVVVMVKDSLPLAFGLAGIVAAVRFRTTLDDSKDAMYVFLATGIGLATAVDLPVAVVLSVVFNTLILIFWFTDFGHAPAALDGAVGERRLRSAAAHPSRTNTFVARIDDEVLREMSAEQLKAIADRAWRRARTNDPDVPGSAGEDRQERRLLVRTHDAEGSRRALEPVLDAYLKRWRFDSQVQEDDGTEVLEFVVQLRKSAGPEDVLKGLRSAAGSHVVGAEFG